MIMLLGPDHTGKTVLADRLKEYGYNVYHFTKTSGYSDYVEPMVSLKLWNGVLDRCMVCEYPYSKVMNRAFSFTIKQWHNLILLALSQNPVVLLCMHKPEKSEYATDQYLPFEKWDVCMEIYKQFLKNNNIPYTTYDYSQPFSLDDLHKQEIANRLATVWWIPMWEDGWGYAGSRFPKVLLVAERIGPNNTNNIPFETGPTGRMLSELLVKSKTPLGDFAVTNLVKSYRRDPRQPNSRDLELLDVELQYLKPEKIIFMGAVARQGIPVAEKHKIPYHSIFHLGFLHHKTGSEFIPADYIADWNKAIGVETRVAPKLQEEG